MWSTALPPQPPTPITLITASCACASTISNMGTASFHHVNQKFPVNQVFILSSTCWNERSEEHTSELQSLMRFSYAVCCLKKKNIVHFPRLTLLHNYIIY